MADETSPYIDSLETMNNSPPVSSAAPHFDKVFYGLAFLVLVIVILLVVYNSTTEGFLSTSSGVRSDPAADTSVLEDQIHTLNKMQHENLSSGW